MTLHSSFSVNSVGKNTTPSRNDSSEIYTTEGTGNTEEGTENLPSIKVMVIFGSSRSDGETAKSVNILLQNQIADIVDLGQFSISHFDYTHANKDDDFYSVANRMVSADKIVFATPVYWYAMSAQMKIFFDRTSDLISIRKRDGRALKGKETFLLANGTDMELPEGFEVPFNRTSDYFDMNYQGFHYIHTGNNEALRQQTLDGLNAFRKHIFSVPSSVISVSSVVK